MPSSRISGQQLERGGLDPVHRVHAAVADPGEEMRGEQGQILAPLAQRRDLDHQDGQAEEEVLAHPGVPHRDERSIGGGNGAHVDAPAVEPADGPHVAVLQHAQQLRLDLEGQLADFVEEEAPAVRGHEQPRVIGEGPRKRAAAVPEQLAFDEIPRQRGAVDRNERAPRAAAVGVDGARDQLLSGAGLAQDEHRRVAARGGLRAVHDGVHVGGPADDALEAVARGDEPIEALDAVAELGRLQHARDLLQYDFFGVRHRHEVLRAATHRFGRVIHRRVRAHQQHGDVRTALLRFLKQIERAEVGARVAEDDEAQRRAVPDPGEHGGVVADVQNRMMGREQIA
jgi:hypothetical protein